MCSNSLSSAVLCTRIASSNSTPRGRPRPAPTPASVPAPPAPVPAPVPAPASAPAAASLSTSACEHASSLSSCGSGEGMHAASSAGTIVDSSWGTRALGACMGVSLGASRFIRSEDCCASSSVHMKSSCLAAAEKWPSTSAILTLSGCLSPRCSVGNRCFTVCSNT
ncbi:hypothetical protein B484DRAFT_454829, partial [Ochromonadaceae sp. CCMP2298]